MSLDPKRVQLDKMEMEEAYRLDPERAEYVRQQLTNHLSDSSVQRLILDRLPVPANIQPPPNLDHYFADALAANQMGHIKATDASLRRMQANVRNILGPMSGPASRKGSLAKS